MIHLRSLLALAAIACFSIKGAAQIEPIHFEIDSPSKGAAVPYRPCVSGSVAGAKGPIFAVVHPLEIATYHVQTPMTPDSHGKFLGKVYIATEQRQRFENQHFEIRLFANPKVSLQEGQELAYWPAAEAMSDVIVVTRIDDAPDGCEGGKEIASIGQREILAQRPGPVVGDFWRATERNRPFVVAALVFVFLLLSVNLARANQILILLRAGALSFKSFLENAFKTALASLISLYEYLHSECARARQVGWEARGTPIALRTYWLRGIVCVVLLLAVPLADGPEAYVLHARLPLVLRLAPNGHSGLFGSEGPVSIQSASNQNGWANWLVTYLGQLLEHDGLWIVAIGLVAIQTIGGIFLYWGFTGTQPLEFSPWALLRKRWIMFPAFCLLDIAMACLAGLGGAEFSPDTIGWVMPAMIAAIVALVLPWFAALALHYAVENAAECLGPATAIGIVGLICVAEGLVLGIWAAIAVAAVALVAGAFLIACAVGGAVAFFVGSAIAFGEAVREIHDRIFPDRGESEKRQRNWTRAATAATTTVGASIASIAVYFWIVK